MGTEEEDNKDSVPETQHELEDVETQTLLEQHEQSNEIEINTMKVSWYWKMAMVRLRKLIKEEKQACNNALRVQQYLV